MPTITASAPTQEKANELLRGTEVNQHRKDDEYTLTTEWPFPFGRRGDHGRSEPVSMTELYVDSDVGAVAKTFGGGPGGRSHR